MRYNDGLMDGALPVWMVAEFKTSDEIEAPEPPRIVLKTCEKEQDQLFHTNVQVPF